MAAADRLLFNGRHSHNTFRAERVQRKGWRVRASKIVGGEERRIPGMEAAWKLFRKINSYSLQASHWQKFLS